MANFSMNTASLSITESLTFLESRKLAANNTGPAMFAGVRDVQRIICHSDAKISILILIAISRFVWALSKV